MIPSSVTRQDVSSISQLHQQVSQTQQLLSEAMKISFVEKQIILAFLVMEIPRVFLIRQRHFLYNQQHQYAKARAVCFYLAHKHGKVSLTVMAKRFRTNPSNVSRRIDSVKNALDVKVTYNQLIKNIEVIETNLTTFLQQNGNQHA